MKFFLNNIKYFKFKKNLKENKEKIIMKNNTSFLTQPPLDPQKIKLKSTLSIHDDELESLKILYTSSYSEYFDLLKLNSSPNNFPQINRFKI